ncbi:calcium-binding and coiled-coil domain-containing protein 2 isoform X1 [Latimeria chalumnae]|uniref:calcium-binding and coiled-coil domain-containing protein 2 isoform X1 n=1 Tax=Latimeria chalumnae TaxID=7897 RepID=UPI0003C13105|nr:PREDICTED: calcium-binding and coiled-coil domain-containing protein 2 isoform X4 [Latimeria chalumnae]|eukprot:XP_005990117.1 PREDICTED: calcium-binding and coiled-coil domain-containing protein 2 isoform X4 [Latimeria chalumnae]
MSEREDEPPTSNIMGSANFSAVVFQEVQQSYVPGSPVICNYLLTQDIQPHSRDWIGIFKVGWIGTRDYYTFVWAPIPNVTVGALPSEQKVIFEAYYLPREDGEFYQFCYVDHKGVVRGASTPFRFQSVVENYILEADDDILIVTVQEKVEENEKVRRELEKENAELKEAAENSTREMETLRQFQEKAEKSEQVRQELEKENAKLQEAAESHVQELETLQGRLLKSQEDQQQLERKVGELERSKEAGEKQLEQLEKELGPCQEERSRVQEENQVLTQTVKSLKEQNEKLTGKVKQLKGEYETVWQESNSRKMEVNRLEEKNKKLMRENEQLEAKLKTVMDRIDALQFDVENYKKESEKLSSQLEVWKQKAENTTESQQVETFRQQLAAAATNRKELAQRLKDMEVQLKEFKKQEIQSAQQLKAERTSRVETEEKLRKVQEEKEHWRARFDKVDLQHQKCEIMITDLTKDLQDKDSLSQLYQMEKEDLQQQNKLLQNQVTELQETCSRIPPQPRPSGLQHQPAAATPVFSQAPGSVPVLRFQNPYVTDSVTETGDSLFAAQRCPVCDEELLLSEDGFEQHVQSHLRECHVCGRSLSVYSEQEFDDHMYCHSIE